MQLIIYPAQKIKKPAGYSAGQQFVITDQLFLNYEPAKPIYSTVTDFARLRG